MQDGLLKTVPDDSRDAQSRTDVEFPLRPDPGF